jgi:hypothetical protein
MKQRDAQQDQAEQNEVDRDSEDEGDFRRGGEGAGNDHERPRSAVWRSDHQSEQMVFWLLRHRADW